MSHFILVIPKLTPFYLNHEELENVAKFSLRGINSFLINQFAISYSFQLHMMTFNFDFLKIPCGMLNSPKTLQPHWTCKHIHWIDVEFDFLIIVILKNIQLNKNWCVNCTCPHWCQTWHHPYFTSNNFDVVVRNIKCSTTLLNFIHILGYGLTKKWMKCMMI